MYELTTIETFKQGPGAREYNNFRLIKEFDTYDEMIDFISRSLNELKSHRRVLRIWTDVESDIKVLYERPGRVGRLIRKFKVRKIGAIPRPYDDSLI